MPNNQNLEAFQKRLDLEASYKDHFNNTSLLDASTGKYGFRQLHLNGSGTFQVSKTPNLDELDGDIE